MSRVGSLSLSLDCSKRSLHLRCIGISICIFGRTCRISCICGLKWQNKTEKPFALQVAMRMHFQFVSSERRWKENTSMQIFSCKMGKCEWTFSTSRSVLIHHDPPGNPRPVIPFTFSSSLFLAVCSGFSLINSLPFAAYNVQTIFLSSRYIRYVSRTRTKRRFICIMMSNLGRARSRNQTPNLGPRLPRLPRTLHGLTVEASRTRNIES